MRAINNSIIFEFMDDVGKKGFKNATDAGIVYDSFGHDAATPRWAKVLAVGPECTTIKDDDIILIENLRWTEVHEYEELKFWRTTENDVMVVRS